MNINDDSVLDSLNTIILSNRLNKSQTIKIVNLVSISTNITDLMENFEWEYTNGKD